jgi:flagellar hook-associated protein 3 FlgL
MRISTNTVYEQGVASILNQQEALLKTQLQASSGRRILTPADDPVAAARALDVTQAESLNTQYSQNRNNAKSSLGLVEGVLQGVTTLIQDVQTVAVNAGNQSLTDNDRAILATELRGRLDELIGLANSTDGAGQYLFSGYQGATKPFAQTAAGVVQYSGDQGQRLIQVSASRQLAVSNSGTDIFERIQNGNGVFVTSAAAANSGSGVISAGTVVTPASLTGHNYQITFTTTAGVTTYDVVDTSTVPAPTTLSTLNPYTSGSAISFDGLQFDIQGVPANGDQFTVAPSTNQSLFKTISDLIAVLAAPAGGAAGDAKLSNGLKTALLNLDRGLDNILVNRSAVGTRLQEVDALQSTGDDLAVQYQQTLSQLQDVDYAKTLSNLNQQQMYLEAAQKSFTKVSGLSLFNYL